MPRQDDYRGGGGGAVEGLAATCKVVKCAFFLVCEDFDTRFRCTRILICGSRNTSFHRGLFLSLPLSFIVVFSSTCTRLLVVSVLLKLRKTQEPFFLCFFAMFLRSFLRFIGVLVCEVNWLRVACREREQGGCFSSHQPFGRFVYKNACRETPAGWLAHTTKFLT